MPAVCPGCARPGVEPRCAFCGVARVAGGYSVERILGQGASGRVYRAIASDGTMIALKELQFATVPGAQQIDAFEREAATLKTLQHPRIPRFIESFQEGEGVQLRLCLAAEFIDGEPLSARIARGPLSEVELRDVAAQVLGVLVYLHKLGLLHRDIKPDNLIVRPGGELVLVDFGTARRLSGSRTFGATLVGTFGYMPTEQLGGTVDATSDLYALGATLLHAATGKPPAELLAADFSLRVAAGIPLRDLISRLVQPRRDRRLRSAEAALAALENPSGPPAVRPRFALAAALALVVGGVIASSLPRAFASAPLQRSVAVQPAGGTPAQRWFVSRSSRPAARRRSAGSLGPSLTATPWKWRSSWPATRRPRVGTAPVSQPAAGRSPERSTKREPCSDASPRRTAGDRPESCSTLRIRSPTPEMTWRPQRS